MVEKTTGNHGNHQPIYEQNLRFLVKTKEKKKIEVGMYMQGTYFQKSNQKEFYHKTARNHQPIHEQNF